MAILAEIVQMHHGSRQLLGTSPLHLAPCWSHTCPKRGLRFDVGGAIEIIDR